MATESPRRILVAINLAIGAAGLLLLARLGHVTLSAFDERQTFALGFGVGLIVSGAVVLQLRSTRPLSGFLLGLLGVLAFAFALI